MLQREEALGIKGEDETWVGAPGWIVAPFVKIEKTGEETSWGVNS